MQAMHERPFVLHTALKTAMQTAKERNSVIGVDASVCAFLCIAREGDRALFVPYLRSAHTWLGCCFGILGASGLVFSSRFCSSQEMQGLHYWHA